MQDIQQSLKAHKLTQQDFKQICSLLGREPNLVELGIFSAMWSEHCSYKSSRIYLKGFPTKAEWVVQGPGENAGVIDIGGGIVAVFKMESHNHPSFIEPYAGAATGVGGILRDIFTMGARPVASLNSIRFGDLCNKNTLGTKHRYLLRGVVKGIGDYGNCMGIPTIGGEFSTESCYNGNILVNAFSIGIAKKEEIFYGRAEGIGNPVIYMGSKTGRDGLGGAVMSSDSFNEHSASLRPTVQLGDPFTEKLLLEACLEIFKENLIIGIQDMGAAGLTSSSFEMAGRANSGMRLHLDRVPMRENNMNPYELMLSESQERMLLCAKKGCEKRILEICQKWELDCAIIGEVCEGDTMELLWYDEVCAKLPISPISENAPILQRPVKIPQYLSQTTHKQVGFHPSHSLEEVFKTLWNSLEISSKQWIYEQYDSSVQGNTYRSNEGDASLLRIKENGVGLALSIGCNPRLCYLNPKEGAKRAVAKCGREIAVLGAKPLALTDCLNFGSPENPEVMWQFKESCEGIKEAAAFLQTPVVSGNVSLYNRSDDMEIFPTPSIAMVGIIQNPNEAMDAKFKKVGNALYLLGKNKLEFSGSLYQKYCLNELMGDLDPLDLKAEQQLWKCLYQGIQTHCIQSAKEVGSGGIAITLAKMAILSELGCKIQLDVAELFSESPSLAIVEIPQDRIQDFERITKEYGIHSTYLGYILKESYVQLNDIRFKIKDLRQTFYHHFVEIAQKL
ncbi:phosphoribosylformylglycinamidine synthase II [Helicobacter monodelphidis]|nr:phosphoribosylformylglycinamidine synthase II [Helicobacter sp. 15-1451]